MSERPKKLIEVALPLDEINAACKADKDRKTGTIRNLHKWFAPMPLPAWRALLYAALIDDPDDDEKRAYHLDLIKRLVAKGADLPDQETLVEARRHIAKQFPRGIPQVMDPFCGGGSTLIEAQRLGLPTLGADLNPVPVLITRTLTQLLPRMHGQPPLNPHSTAEPGPKPRKKGSPPEKPPLQLSVDIEGKAHRTYRGYEGLIQDVRHYAEQVKDAAWDRLKDIYPITSEEKPIAWLWARTAKCPSPACGIETILTTSWWLSKKTGELAWIEPSVRDGVVQLRVVSQQTSGEPPAAPKTGDGVFACIACESVLDGQYLRSQGMANRLGLLPTAVVIESGGRRDYRAASPLDHVISTADSDNDRSIAVPINTGGQGIRVGLYGMSTWNTLFTPRQLRTLEVFSDEVAAVHERVLSDGGSEDRAEAVATLLGLAVGRLAHTNSQQTRWNLRNASYQSKAEPGFGRNDLPMTWDFAEPFFMSDSVGDWMGIIDSQVRAFTFAPPGHGIAEREDARRARLDIPGLVATDPPYFDAIGYADLSDFFYVWHRRALRKVHPDLYATIAAPKERELTAIPSHHGNSKEAARKYFIAGFTETFHNLKASMGEGLPMIVVYASKEQKAGTGEETRWAAILTAMIQAELEITGTWPIHGTGINRMISQGTNAVASYVAMVCRPRPQGADLCTLTDFNRALRRELKPAVEHLQAAGILPIDLAQAAMGPGMQVYSRYRGVLDQSGEAISVEQALRLINQALAEVLEEQEGELDPSSRFAVLLWEKYRWGDIAFGEADAVVKTQGITVDDVVRSQVATYPRAGFVKLSGPGDLDGDWSPARDSRPTAWEALHHLANRLIDGGGISDAGRLMAELGGLRDQAQGLVYRLHAIAARQGWTEDQERYNALIGSWSDLLAEAGRVHENRGGLF